MDYVKKTPEMFEIVARRALASILDDPAVPIKGYWVKDLSIALANEYNEGFDDGLKASKEAPHEQN